MKFKLLGIASSSIAVLASTAVAQTYDVAGVRLGMTPQDVRSEMSERSYEEDEEFTRSYRSKALSYQQAVRSYRGSNTSNQDRAGLGSLFFTKSEDSSEQISILFVELPDGPIVQEVIYQSLGNVDASTFDERVRTKYGEPANVESNMAGSSTLNYKAEAEIGDLVTRERLIASVSANSFSPSSIRLTSNLRSLVAKKARDEPAENPAATDF